MRTLRTIVSIALAMTALMPAMAQRSSVDRQIDTTLLSNKIIGIDGTAQQSEIDSLRRQISAFYYDQFQHFQDPGAPYFLFLSKDAKLAMGIGGVIRMRGYYDWGGAMPSPGFAPYTIPMHPSPTDMRHLGTTPAGTCLFFRVLGRNKALGEYQLYIEANFNGYQARDFHLKKAYAIINDFTIGYANSTFSDPAAVPPTVDAQGPTNKLATTAVLIRYMPVVKKHWVFAVSAETPSSAVDVDGTATQKVSNWMPDWAAFAQYQWGSGEHVRLAGIVRTLSYRNVKAARNYNIAGWGLQLSSVAHPLPQLTTYITASYGHGYAGLGGDLLGNYDLVGDPDRAGYLYAPASFGWCLGVQYNIRPDLFVSASASHTRYLPAHRVSPDEYKYGMMADINIFWNLTPRIQVGAEYDWGKRQNFSRHHRYAHRIGAMCQFSF